MQRIGIKTNAVAHAAHRRAAKSEMHRYRISRLPGARQRGGELTVSREQVQFSIVRPGETILPAGEPETLVEAS